MLCYCYCYYYYLYMSATLFLGTHKATDVQMVGGARVTALLWEPLCRVL